MSVPLCGAERGFLARHPTECDPLFEAASHAAGTDLAGLLGKENSRISDPRLEQFAWYALSCAIADVLLRNGVTPTACAGYSFGVYPALYACGAVDFQTGLAIAREAFCAATSHAGKHLGMAVVVGLAQSEIARLIALGQWTSLRIAIENSDACFALSGLSDELHALLNAALASDAVSAQMIETDIPYHHAEYLLEVSASLSEIIPRRRISRPAYPLISTIDQAALMDADAIANYVAANISSPISWRRTVVTLASMNIGRIVECGPGISLTQSGRFIDANIDYVNCKNLDRKLGL